jgi:DNA mismatch repair protein MSH5
VGIIRDLEASIIRQLEQKVLEFETQLADLGVRLSEIDVLASFAEVSQDYKYVRPKLVAEPLLLVKGARHPLQEITVETFVPNDIAVSNEKTQFACCGL